MSDFLRERADAAKELSQLISGPQLCCGVVGLGFIGSTWALALAESGARVRTFDRAEEVAQRFSCLLRPESREPERLAVSKDPAELAEAAVVLMAVRVPLDPQGVPNFEPLREAARQLARWPRRPRLVVLTSTVPPGLTREFAEQWLDAAARPELFVAHTPERLAVGHGVEQLRTTPHLVGGLDDDARDLACRFLSRVCDRVEPVAAPEVSELSKLLENAFRTVGISLVSEVVKLAHRLGVSGRDVSEAAATKPFGYFPFHPGPGLGGHCLPNDLALLRDAAKRLGEEVPLLDATALGLSEQPRVVVERLGEICGGLSGKRVLLVGVGFKVGAHDTSESPALSVSRHLRATGATLGFVDGFVEELQVDGESIERIESTQLQAGCFDACIVLSGDAQLDARQLSESVPVVLDAGGGAVLRGTLAGAHRL